MEKIFLRFREDDAFYEPLVFLQFFLFLLIIWDSFIITTALLCCSVITMSSWFTFPICLSVSGSPTRSQFVHFLPPYVAFPILSRCVQGYVPFRCFFTLFRVLGCGIPCILFMLPSYILDLDTRLSQGTLHTMHPRSCLVLQRAAIALVLGTCLCATMNTTSVLYFSLSLSVHWQYCLLFVVKHPVVMVVHHNKQQSMKNISKNQSKYTVSKTRRNCPNKSYFSPRKAGMKV